MALSIIVLLISFIPSLLMFLFLRNNRKEDEEYRKDCLRLLGKGFLITILVFLSDFVLKYLWFLTGIAKNHIWIDRLFTCFIINATVEEVCKFLVANKYIKKNKEKVSRLDIISFIAIAAISFGLLEDVVYVFTTNIGQIIVRGILMGHVPYALIMGLFYCKSIAENKPVYKILAFLVPILLHGSYNFLLSEGLPDWTAFIVVSEVIIETIFMIYMVFFIRKKRNDETYLCPIFNNDIEN